MKPSFGLNDLMSCHAVLSILKRKDAFANIMISWEACEFIVSDQASIQPRACPPYALAHHICLSQWIVWSNASLFNSLSMLDAFLNTGFGYDADVLIIGRKKAVGYKLGLHVCHISKAQWIITNLSYLLWRWNIWSPYHGAWHTLDFQKMMVIIILNFMSSFLFFFPFPWCICEMFFDYTLCAKDWPQHLWLLSESLSYRICSCWLCLSSIMFLTSCVLEKRTPEFRYWVRVNKPLYWILGESPINLWVGNWGPLC